MSQLQVLPTPSAAPQSPSGPASRWPLPHVLLLLAFWLAIFAASCATPPLLDDADATHAQAAQSMLHTGDLVTLHVNGIRYLEKAPLPYWIAALSLKLFGNTAFAIHFPLALTVLALALLGYAWSRRAFSPRTALYTALFVLTSAGVFLFTRIFIPDALLSLLLALALYAFLLALDPTTNPGGPFMTRSLRHGWGGNAAYLMWTALALAVLTKGLVALVFFFATAIVFIAWTKSIPHLHRLRPFSGILLFLFIAAPWHILAGIRNTNGANGHGFFWFYFINEHVLRFLGRRIPQDFNKLPAALYWSLHLVWLFPWSLFAPAAILIALRKRRERQTALELDATGARLSRLELISRRKSPPPATFAYRTVLLLSIFSAIVLFFFSLSTNQEYYTFPVYLPLLILLAAALAPSEPWALNPKPSLLHRTLTLTYATFTLIGLAIAAALTYGLWTSRHLPFVPDIGALLAHRNVGNYTLSMSHFFDLTGPSFAALRLPASMAAIAFLLGPGIAWFLHTRRKPFAAILTIATTSTLFLIAAHIALVRFAPMLSSQDFAATIQHLDPTNSAEVLLYGDQAFGSSIPFYLDRHVSLVDGRSTSMLFGSTFPDAPPLFLTTTQLFAQWGTGPRKILFVPPDLDPARRDQVDQLLRSPHTFLLKETSNKALITDRPLSP